MPFRIRTKLIVAFFGLTLILLSVTGIVGYYNQMASREVFQEVEEISKEVRITGDLQLIFERILMPANDYIITGNRKYIDDFKRDAKELETLLKEAGAIIVKMEKVTPEFTAEETNILSDVNVAWLNIKDISNRIFAISNPVGNMEAARLMEEMDYKWGRPAADGVHKWHELDYREYEEAIESARSVWLRLWIIMGGSAVMLVLLGIAFAVFYSGLFVKPIQAIHNGADAIAAGNFKTRLDIKTGDEIEQLSNAMNEMAEQLDSFYGTLERQVEEKTRELQESVDRYHVLGMAAPNAIICLKAPDTVIFWNRRAEEMFGYSEEEVIGKPMHGLIVPERYRDKAGEGMKNFFKTGTGPVVGKKTELSALRRDGSEFPIELSLSSINIGGEWQATGIVRDITERKQAEEIIKKERDLAQTYLDIAGVMFVAIDSNEKVILVNKSGTEVLGCPEGEIIGKNWFDNFLPERVRDEIKGIFRKLITGEDDSVEYVENPVLTCSGEERVIAWHNTALKDEAGNIIATLSSGEDITDRKKAEEKLKQRIDDLEMFRKVTVKRELRMEELQRKVDELEKELKRK